ncbi:MAG: DJ-1/PfpI family protein [Burkholderiales bacterium]|jgi:putative intracellular protease/amidase|nr:MAG: DJ-1/PfpI family protein [Burkholderiales bacterium]
MTPPNATTTVSAKPRKIGIVLFEQFETLDVFGPVQMLGRLPDYELVAVSESGASITSSQGLPAGVHSSFAAAPQMDGLLVPGGQGTRREIDNPTLLDFLRRQFEGTAWTASVCTGAALLAKAGILDGRRATTNKIAFDWVASQSAHVDWQRRARWVVDGKLWTSSGVSAGTDMALALVEFLHDRSMAMETARRAEYVWSNDPSDDPFAIAEGVDL